MTWVEFGIF